VISAETIAEVLGPFMSKRCPSEITEPAVWSELDGPLNAREYIHCLIR
jgi:hypothetical protein